MSRFYNPGFAVHALPLKKDIWQFTLLAIGHDWDDDDHDEFPLVTWYVQLLFWQFSYSREIES